MPIQLDPSTDPRAAPTRRRRGDDVEEHWSAEGIGEFQHHSYQALSILAALRASDTRARCSQSEPARHSLNTYRT